MIVLRRMLWLSWNFGFGLPIGSICLIACQGNDLSLSGLSESAGGSCVLFWRRESARCRAMSSPRQPTQGMADQQSEVARSIRLSGIRFDDSQKRLGEEANGTAAVATTPTVQMELQGHLASVRG